MTKLEQKKLEAVKALKKLKIYEPYIYGFENHNEVCYFEGCAGYWAHQDKELMKKIKQLEEKYKCVVYAVTHEITSFGDLYSFLIITNYKEEWPTLLEQVNVNTYHAFAYVWNKTDNDCSEFGTVEIRSFCGGIIRIN